MHLRRPSRRARARARGAMLAVLLAAIGLTGCSPATGGSGTGPSDGAPTRATAPSDPSASIDLTVLGAASLRAALEAVATEYEAGHPGVTIVVATDSSAALATKIEQGAPADVFLSADSAAPTRLAGGGLTDGPPVDFAANALALIVPMGNPGGLASPADLAKPGIKVVAAADSVPVATYTAQLLANLARVPGYPPDLAARYAANVVSQEDNVRAIVTKIELGEGDAGIVYATDARASTRVSTIAIPQGSNVRATYAGAVIASSRHLAAARAFMDWIAGPAGQEVLARFGFLPPA